jgi:hypothetical protein
MSFRKNQVAKFGLAALAMASMATRAEGFRCVSSDGKVSLSSGTSYEVGDALTEQPLLVVGAQSVKLEESQYKNIGGELFLYSVRDENNPRGIPVNRVVRLDAKIDSSGKGRGTLSVHRDFGGRIVDPLKVSVSCKID